MAPSTRCTPGLVSPRVMHPASVLLLAGGCGPDDRTAAAGITLDDRSQAQ